LKSSHFILVVCTACIVAVFFLAIIIAAETI
jgi:hypothetical protein